jgi:hypothetical protein
MGAYSAISLITRLCSPSGSWEIQARLSITLVEIGDISFLPISRAGQKTNPGDLMGLVWSAF